MDSNFPTPFRPLVKSIFLVNSYHTHELKTCRSTTGLIGYIGGNPVIWYAKKQGIIFSSTYATECSALCTVIEKAQSFHYILHCLGCNAPSDGSCPTRIFGDNLSLIINQNQAADLSKKYVATFHVVKETMAAGIIEPYWFKGEFNTSDIMTKYIPHVHFRTHCDYI